MAEPFIGIDLGTTNSCMSIAAELEEGFTVDGLAGISIITDEHNRKVTPSVLAYNDKAKPPKSPFIIGHAAKQRFTSYPPVMFAKRHMGTNKRFHLTDDKDISPEEVSAEILRYLKNLAEEKLGRPVSRAVVTVPAYFGTEQKQLTAEAMNRAGFITDLQNSIIIEPVAAAFAYAATCTKENLKILVYDLGGGTFDATILEKTGSNIEVSAFGGDHALGGYNFDLLLSDHILSELRKNNYALELDTETNQEDRVRYSKLLLEAERAKIEISQPSMEEVFLRHPAIFEDQEGESVDLDMRLDRQTFEDLIAPLVERTMEECQTVLEKSGLQVEDLDAIVMVGGSSFIPMIQKRIKELFGRPPELFEPDLCVALGAALYACTLGTTTQDKVILILQPLPNETSSPVIEMCGKVTRLDGGPPEKGYEIEVRDAAGAVYLKQPMDADGGYLLDVDLEKNAENQFFISVLNPQAETEAATTATIHHSDQASDTELEGVGQTGIITLPQSIYIQRQFGSSVLAEEGVELPYEKMEEFEIGVEGVLSENGSYTLRVELLEGDLPIGVVTVDEIPGTIEDGAAVEVNLTINQDSRIIASVYIPSVDREGRASFKTSKVEILTLSVLKGKLENLAAEWHTLKLMLEPEQKAKFGPKIDRMFERADQFLNVTDPDTSELTRIVRQIRNKMAPLVPQEMNPVMEVFNALCREVSEHIKRAEKKSAEIREHNFRRSLDVLKSQALKAYDNLDQEQWHGCYLQIQQLGQRIESMIGPPPELPPPAVLIVMLEELLRDIKKEARALSDDDPRKKQVLAEVDEISEEIKKIAKHKDEDQKQHELVSLYLNRIVALQEKLEMKRPGLVIIK